MKRKKQPKHYFLLEATGKTPVRFGCKVSDARRKVTIARTKADVMRGISGLAITCANAVCAIRQDGDVFPHPVYVAEFTKNRAYFVDKVDRNGVPIHCVRYAHNEGPWQDKFDEKGKRAVIRSGQAEKNVVLYPPPKGSTSRSSHARGKSDGSRTTKISKGAMARAQRAGITFGV